MSQPLPSVLVVMGVSGSGKSTIAALLAGRLAWEYADADEFHTPANIAKMHGGTPLTDEDRQPWLENMAAWIQATAAIGRHGVLACSALKRDYRRTLAGAHQVAASGATDTVRLIYLRGDKALITRRQAARHNHFMPATLVDSQFATLEEPGPEEHPLTVSIAAKPHAIVDHIITSLAA